MSRSVFTVLLSISLLASFVFADVVEYACPYSVQQGRAFPAVADAVRTEAMLHEDIVMNVRACGAIGDGIADDTGAIQAAIDAATAAGGAVVFFPSGIYRCQLTLGTTSGSRDTFCASLQGSGANTTHLVAVAADMPVVQMTGKAAVEWTWAIRDLSFIGNGRDSNGVDIDGVFGVLTCRFENVAFFECNYGFHNKGAFRYTFDRCTFSRNNFGVYMEALPTTYGGCGSFEDCHWCTNHRAAFVQLDTGNGDDFPDVHVVGGMNHDNLGFGFFLKGGAGRLRPLIIDNVYMEANGAAASVAIAGASYKPGNLYLEDTGSVILQNMVLSEADVISNTAIRTSNCIRIGARQADALPATAFTLSDTDSLSRPLSSAIGPGPSGVLAKFNLEASAGETAAAQEESRVGASVRSQAEDVAIAAVVASPPEDQWTNVKSWGAKGDGSTDDTAAIQLAISRAKVSSGIVYFPTGEYRITDGLEIDESLTICGSRSVFRDWASHGWFVPKGAVILFDARDADTSPVFKCTFDAPKKGCPLVFHDLTIKVTENARQAGRHGIEVNCTTGSTLSDVLFERLVFVTVPGDCIYIHGNSYLGHPITFRDIKAYEAGRLIRVYDENQGYIAGLVTLENCDFEGATLIPKLSPLVDLRSAGILTVRNLLCEGYDMSGKTVLGLGSMGGRVLVDNYYSEWSVASPQYDIELYEHPAGVTDLVSAHSYRRLKLEAPIRIDVDSVKVEIDNAYWDDGHRYDQIISIADALQQVDVTLHNIRYNGTNLSNAQLFGRLMEPNNIGRIHADGFAGDGIAQGMRFETPDTGCLYEWTAARGRLSAYKTRHVAPKSPPTYFALYGSSDFIVTDPYEGRVAKFVANENRCPTVYWDWSLPPDYGECELMMAVRYRVEAVGAPDHLSYHLSAQSGHVPGKRHLFTRIVDTANSIRAPDRWSVAVAKYTVAPTGFMGFRCTDPPEGGRYDLYISHVWVGLGDKVPFLRGDVAGNQPVEWRDVTCPANANWVSVAGDTVINAKPGPGEPSRWTYSNSAWTVMDILPGAVAKASNYVVTVSDNGKRFSNAGATGPIAFVLCPDSPSLEFEFVRVEPYPVYIAPQGGDRIRGGGPGKRLILDTDGELIRLGCFKADTWDMIRIAHPEGSKRPLAFEP